MLDDRRIGASLTAILPATGHQTQSSPNGSRRRHWANSLPFMSTRYSPRASSGILIPSTSGESNSVRFWRNVSFRNSKANPGLRLATIVQQITSSAAIGICERSIPMSSNHSDALVFYGATGDLAFKKIFPALQAMVRRGHLDVPVVGMARSAWTLDQLRQRVHDSLEKYGGVDPPAFEKLSGLLRYVSMDYTDPGACRAIHAQLKESRHAA